jgi:hypothetical protein
VLQLRVNCKPIAIQQGLEHGTSRRSIVSTRNLATTTEDYNQATSSEGYNRLRRSVLCSD